MVTNIETSSPDTTKPTVTNVAADITGPTKDNVTVTADFNDDVEVKSKLYKINDGAWQDYTGGVVVTDNNTTITFKAVDTSDNESNEASITITNIDKVKPTITGITPSTTEPAASVTVTATFDDNVGVATQQYKIGEGSWQDYTTGVTVTTNTTVYFKAVDTAGNEGYLIQSKLSLKQILAFLDLMNYLALNLLETMVSLVKLILVILMSINQQRLMN